MPKSHIVMQGDQHQTTKTLHHCTSITHDYLAWYAPMACLQASGVFRCNIEVQWFLRFDKYLEWHSYWHMRCPKHFHFIMSWIARKNDTLLYFQFDNYIWPHRNKLVIIDRQFVDISVTWGSHKFQWNRSSVVTSPYYPPSIKYGLSGWNWWLLYIYLHWFRNLTYYSRIIIIFLLWNLEAQRALALGPADYYVELQ